MLKNLKNKELLLSFFTGLMLVGLLVFGFRSADNFSSVFYEFKNLGGKFIGLFGKYQDYFDGPKISVKGGIVLENDAKPIDVSEMAMAYEKQITVAVEKSAPSVVSIIVSKDLPIFEQYYVNPFQGFGFDFPDSFGIPQLRQKGTEKQEIGGGSGFVVSNNGFIVTNKHVASDSEAEYAVIFNDGQKLKARIVARDPSFDLAVLKVEKTGLVPLPLGDSSKLKLGSTVIAIGNALGEFSNTVSLGVVSGLNRSVDIENEKLTGLVQTDAAINKGNSGGPLLNLSGEVVGINTAMAQGAENICFAIPINQVKKVISQVEKTGELKVAYLGVRYQMVTKELQKSKDLASDYGALIISGEVEPGVMKGSPAEQAGLEEGDIILEINGTKPSGMNALASILREFSPGDTIFLKLMRDSKEMTLEARLGER